MTYIELPASAGLPTPASTAVLRVELKREDLRRYGVEAPLGSADLLTADFVVGEDGLARAIRIIQ